MVRSAVERAEDVVCGAEGGSEGMLFGGEGGSEVFRIGGGSNGRRGRGEAV